MRSHGDIAQALSEVKPHFQAVDDHPTMNDIESWIRWHGRFYVKIGAEGRVRFETTVRALWTIDADLRQTVSEKTVESAIVDLLLENTASGSQITSEDVRRLLQRLLQPPVQEWTVSRPVEDAASSAIGPVALGPVLLFQLPYHREQFLAAAKIGDDEIAGAHWDRDALIACTRVRAREPERARELADERFRQFDDILRFLLPIRTTGTDFGVFEFRDRRNLTGIVSSDKAIAVPRIRLGSTGAIVVTESPFLGTGLSDGMWNAMVQEKPTELQRRLLRCGEWVGRGLRESHGGKAYTLMCIGFEALLQNDLRQAFSPGVVVQLSETAAFIAGTTLEERLQIEREVRKLYEQRSAIFHGRVDEASEEVVYKLMDLVHMLVETILTHEDFRGMTNFEEIQSWVRQQKYRPR